MMRNAFSHLMRTQDKSRKTGKAKKTKKKAKEEMKLGRKTTSSGQKRVHRRVPPFLPRPRGRGQRFTSLPGGEERAMEARCKEETAPLQASGRRTPERQKRHARARRALHRGPHRPGWSTTRDCAVITAACGRKHVGTRGRGGSSAFVRIQRMRARAYIRVGIAR